jgi:hypothetical protein
MNNHISGSLQILDATAKHNVNTIVSKVSNLRETDTDASLPNERLEVCIFARSCVNRQNVGCQILTFFVFSPMMISCLSVYKSGESSYLFR